MRSHPETARNNLGRRLIRRREKWITRNAPRSRPSVFAVGENWSQKIGLC
jgi:hypothetical protein